MTTNQENIKLLEKIYGRTVKASDVYHNASKNVHNKPLTEFFEQAALTHDRFADDLKQKLKSIGNEVSESNFIKSTDEFWQDFASLIVGRNEAAILKSCLRAEEKAIVMYDEALGSNALEEGMKQKISTQRDYAKNLAEEVNSLEKQYASD